MNALNAKGGAKVVRGMIKQLGMFFFLLCFSVACGEVGGSGQCGGAEDTGSCLRIEKIVPTSSAGEDSSNVDVIQSVCNAFEVANATSTPVAPIYEKFTDHSARISVSNRPLQNLQKQDISDITLLNYAIEYTLNQCPVGAACPILSPQIVKPGETIVVRVEETLEFSLPFVPLAAKKEYVALNGTSGAYPSYTATYTITGTDSFKNPISVKGSSEFTIGNYNLCAS